jgi:hypothetical protein
MALTITHLDGPLAGRSQSFADDKARIVFGRDPNVADVVWPPDYTAVSRQHFALVKTTGGYRFELGDSPVLIDGRPAYQDQYFEDTHELQLGDESGPRLRVESSLGAAAAMPATAAYKNKNVSAHEQAQKTKKTVAWVAGGLAVIAVGVGVALWQVNQIEPVNLAAYTEQIKKEVSAELATTVSPETLAEVQDSVYLVLVRSPDGNEVAAATAWVVGPGVMATNAHVGDIFNQIGPGMQLLVRSPKRPFQTHKVLSVDIHPGYTAFDAAVAEYEPVVIGLHGELDQPSLVPAYDVSLMYVDNAETLAQPLKLAPMDELAALLPGVAVAYIGYPTEQLANVDAIRAPNPVVQSGGTLVGITDYFNVHREDSINHLIQHNLGATGGASGSPIFNAKGEVVAVLSGGNIIITPEGRAPSAVGINFAQRADLVQELLDGVAAEKIVAYQRVWAEGLALFDNFRSALPRVMLSDLKAWANSDAEPQVLEEKADKIGPLKEDWGVKATIYQYEVQPGAYGFYAISDQEEDINLAVISEGEVQAINDDTDWHPIVGVSFDKATPIQVVVYSQVEGTGYDFKGLAWPKAAPPSQ